MSIDRQLLTPQQQETLDLIENQKLLVSIKFDVSGNYSGGPGYSINYDEIDSHLLNVLADLEDKGFRDSRSADFFGDSWIPKYDMLLAANEEITVEMMVKAKEQNQPILIKHSDGTFSIYGFYYYDELQWQKRSLTDLDDSDKQLLNRFCFDGRVLKKEDGYPVPNNPNESDAELLFTLTSRFHKYLPPVINKMNMTTREVYLHNPGQDRFTINKGKINKFGPKMSTTLEPKNPRYMELFDCDDGVGFSWNIDKCNLHGEEYVLDNNGGTNGCFWLNLNAGYDYDYEANQIRYYTAEEKIAVLNNALDTKDIEITSVAEIRERNRLAVQNKTPLFWNELVVGPPKGNVQAIFATQDKRICRLRAYYAMQHTKQKLNLSEDIPLFINQPFYGQLYNAELGVSKQREAVFRFYQADEQKADLISEMAEKEGAKFAKQIIENQTALAISVTDKSSIDNYLESTTPVDVALLPTQPEWMQISDDDTPAVGLLWDINNCTLDEDALDMIDGLEAQNDEAVSKHQAIKRNSLPVTLPKNKITGMFCYSREYDMNTRAKAVELAAYVKEKLGLTTNIPIFLIQKETNTIIYDDLNQLMDQNYARWSLARHPQAQPPKTPYEKFVEKEI